MWSGCIKRVLVLLPPALIDSWKEEAKKIIRGYHKLKDIVFVYSAKQSFEDRNKKLREKHDKGMPILVIASNCLVSTSSGSRSNNALFPTGKDKHQSWDWVIIDEAHSKAKSKDTEVDVACMAGFR